MDSIAVEGTSIHKTPERKNIFEGLYGAISKFVSSYIAKTSLTPNQITLISGIFGIIGAALLISQKRFHLFLAGIFIQSYCILDAVDGYIARLKNMQSLFGKWLDTFFDKLNDFLIILCLSLGLYLRTKEIQFLYLGIILMGLVFFIQFSMISDSILCSTLEKRNRLIQRLGTSDTRNTAFVMILRRIDRLIGRHFLLEHCAFLFLVSLFAIINEFLFGFWFIIIHALFTLLFTIAKSMYRFKHVINN